MFGLARMGAAVIVLYWFAVSPVAAELCRVSFAHEPLNSARLSSVVEKALLYINDDRNRNPARGTAFLIDRDRGIYLTAAHVVEARTDYRIAENRERIFLNARNPHLSSDRISLQVLAFVKVDRDPGSEVLAYALDDFAILQLRDFTLPNDVQPLELALRAPLRESIRFTGYGSARPEDLHPRVIDEFRKWQLDRMSSDVYRVAASVDGGDSGGPVLLDNGNVIGFITRKRSSDEAIVHPLIRYVPHIISAGAHQGDHLIDLLFSPQDVNQRIADAVELLKPTPGGISNLEWALTIRKLDEMGRIAELDTELLECPLHIAAEQREIGAFGSPISYEWFSRNYAAAEPAELLNEAARADQRGETLQAIALYDLARDGFRVQIASLMGEEPAQRAFAGSLTRASESAPPGETPGIFPTAWTFQEAIGTLAARLETAPPANIVIEVTPENASRFRTYTSDRLSVALHDYGRALARGNDLRSQLMGPAFVDQASREAAIRATAIGATVAGSPNWKQLNLDTLQYSLSNIEEEMGIEFHTLASRPPDDRFLLGIGIGEALGVDWTQN